MMGHPQKLSHSRKPPVAINNDPSTRYEERVALFLLENINYRTYASSHARRAKAANKSCCIAGCFLPPALR